MRTTRPMPCLSWVTRSPSVRSILLLALLLSLLKGLVGIRLRVEPLLLAMCTVWHSLQPMCRSRIRSVL